MLALLVVVGALFQVRGLRGGMWLLDACAPPHPHPHPHPPSPPLSTHTPQHNAPHHTLPHPFSAVQGKVNAGAVWTAVVLLGTRAMQVR